MATVLWRSELYSESQCVSPLYKMPSQKHPDTTRPNHWPELTCAMNRHRCQWWLIGHLHRGALACEESHRKAVSGTEGPHPPPGSSLSSYWGQRLCPARAQEAQLLSRTWENMSPLSSCCTKRFNHLFLANILRVGWSRPQLWRWAQAVSLPRSSSDYEKEPQEPSW